MSKEIDSLLQPFYDACFNKGLCVHECQYFDERHLNNHIYIKVWTGQRASIFAYNNKVTFRNFKDWKYNFGINNNKGCMQCNNIFGWNLNK